jgi:hypothetical protein
LLYLLPHRSPNLIDSENPWKANSAEEFASLPVVTILGLPHVLKMARDRGDIDSNGRTFIQFSDSRRYLPQRLKLNSVRYHLVIERELKTAFDQRCFDQEYKHRQPWFDDDSLSIKQGPIDSVYNASLANWLSSPLAIADSIEQNLATLGVKDERYAHSDRTDGEIEVLPQLSFWEQPASGQRGRRSKQRPKIKFSERQHETPLHLSLVDRRSILEPLLDKLFKLNINEDNKFAKLLAILVEHVLNKEEKAIIYVGRHLTALYLFKNLLIEFNNKLRIGSTVEPGETSPKLKPGQHRSEILKRFSPRSHNYDADKEYDILICTDADGVGVNLQDANVIVNYDPPEGADVLFQRAGRVLRMTPDSERIVYFYTLVPSICDYKESDSDVHQRIRDIFNRITQRHDKSKQILGSDVISQESYKEIELDSDLEVEQLTRDSQFLKDIGGLNAESAMTHTAILEQYRHTAECLPEYLLSARSYSKLHSRIFVLLKKGDTFHPIMFNIPKQELEKLTDLTILDMIACQESEPRAMIKPAEIEHQANTAVQFWCAQEMVLIEQVLKVCALYLVPKNQQEQFTQILK